jgi:hypothetical protein
VWHEQSDVVIPRRFRRRDVDELRGCIAHRVELQDGERRWLLVSLGGIVVAVRKCGRRQQDRGEPE